jgi:hypothetical protein
MLTTLIPPSKYLGVPKELIAFVVPPIIVCNPLLVKPITGPILLKLL